MASNKTLKFFHVSALPTSNIVTGGIYFNATAQNISVYNGTSWENYGGKILDASFADNVLTITKNDNTSVTLDFSDVASATNVNTLLGGLRTDVNNLQTAAGIADGATAPSWATSGSTELKATATLKAGIEAVDAAASAAASAASAASSKVDTSIAALDYTSTGAAGSYIQKVSETDGVIAETVVAFDTTVGAATGTGAATDSNAPTSKAVRTAVDAAESTAKSYADSAISSAFGEYNASTNAAGKKLSGTIADNATDTTYFVTAKQVSDFASGVTGAMHFIDTAIKAADKVDGTTYTDVTLGGVSAAVAKENYVPAAGDIILFGTQEFVYSGSAWQLFGDEGTYATKAQLEALDKADNVSDAASGITVKVDQTDGLISKPVVTVGEAVLATDDTSAPTGKSCAYLATGKQVFDAIAAVKGTLESGDYTTIEALSDAVKAEEAKTGALSSLTTTAQTNLVAAINEVDANVDANTTAIGVKKSTGVDATGLYKYIDDAVAAEEARAKGVEGTPDSGYTLQGEIDALEALHASGKTVAQEVSAGIDAIALSDSQTRTGGTTDDGLSLSVAIDMDATGSNKKLSVSGSIAANTYDAYGAAATAKSDVIGASTDASTASTIYGAKAYTDAAKTELIGNGTTATTPDTASSNTIEGAKRYADSLWYWESWA